MGTHIYIRNFGMKGYLARLGTISTVMPIPAAAITLHTCYILISIALSLLLLGNTFLRSGVLRDTLTFLGLFGRKKPFALMLTSLGN